MITKNDVVQFNQNHEWCGSLGIVNELKQCGEDIRYMVEIPIPQRGSAYIYVMQSENAIEFVGQAIFIPRQEV